MKPRALRSFTVRAQIPDVLRPLHELATNLRWSWDSKTRDLFRWLDSSAWEQSGHDPLRTLRMVGRERLDALARDPSFLAFMDEVRADLERLMTRPRWYQGRDPQVLTSVAYFSPEFGIDRALPQYSGGLGVLAGDHLKAAGALGVPIVGIGLFYRQGYFRQELSNEGWQQERYVHLDPYEMPLAPVEGAKVEIDLAGVPVRAQVWKVQVGRVPLFLLDSHVDENDEDGRLLTDRLYSGPEEHRLRQEILLGVGGIRALDAFGVEPQVFHINEGHAGFLLLERIRRLVTAEGLTVPEAVEAVRAGSAFTTHTPVAAGIDRFPRHLIERYFARWCDQCGVTTDELMAIGHEPGASPDAPFNMAVMAFRLSGWANGVSRLHGHVSRRLFEHLWPGVPTEEIPIGSVTNGVHARTWTSPEMADLYDRHVLPEWYEAGEDRWARIDEIRDEDLWRVRERGRERLVEFVRRRIKESALARGAAEEEVAWCDETLNPKIMTIGFARRFATYKRAALLLSQPERLKALLTSFERPVQIVFAGKAHPADDAGKEMIRRIVEFSRDPEVRHRLVFVEDYDMELARILYQGCDVWLNNPRRPMEACGTSGEKAALNGALNCSIRDGWWDEMYEGENGWAIPSAENQEDEAVRDRVEAGNLFDLLERQVIPLFYETDGSIPTGWVRRMAATLRSLGPKVSASRMVREYVERIYEPAAGHAARLAAGGHARARALAAWKARVRAAWPDVRVESVEGEVVPVPGVSQAIEAHVRLGGLSPTEVEVQLLCGPVNPDGELEEASIHPMDWVFGAPGGAHRFQGSFRCEESGRAGFTVRVVPRHEDLTSFAELGCVAWA